jgi:hypothetical protein
MINKKQNIEFIISDEPEIIIAYEPEFIISDEPEIIYQTQHIEKNNYLKNQRASVEYNGMELVCGLLLVNGDINNYDELKNVINNMKTTLDETKIKFNNETDFYEYVKDIDKKKDIIDNYIKNYKKSIETISNLNVDNIEVVYISGKKNKHTEINELNDGLCKLETKSDIYIKQKNNVFIGLSVKQSKDATKSNYSAQKMLGKEKDEQLTKIKKIYLIEQGFPKFNKMDRDKVNALFYPQNKLNPYMNKLKEEIQNNKKNIAKVLVEKLYCSNVNYDVYEFDGIELTKLVRIIDESDIIFEEHLPYYYNTKGEEREAAKLFYKLTCNDKKYRVEVRWKGNIHNASPQFQIHEE